MDAAGVRDRLAHERADIDAFLRELGNDLDMPATTGATDLGGAAAAAGGDSYLNSSSSESIESRLEQLQRLLDQSMTNSQLGSPAGGAAAAPVSVGPSSLHSTHSHLSIGETAVERQYMSPSLRASGGARGSRPPVAPPLGDLPSLDTTPPRLPTIISGHRTTRLPTAGGAVNHSIASTASAVGPAGAGEPMEVETSGTDTAVSYQPSVDSVGASSTGGSLEARQSRPDARHRAAVAGGAAPPPSVAADTGAAAGAGRFHRAAPDFWRAEFSDLGGSYLQEGADLDPLQPGVADADDADSLEDIGMSPSVAAEWARRAARVASRQHPNADLGDSGAHDWQGGAEEDEPDQHGGGALETGGTAASDTSDHSDREDAGTKEAELMLHASDIDEDEFNFSLGTEPVPHTVPLPTVAMPPSVPVTKPALPARFAAGDDDEDQRVSMVSSVADDDDEDDLGDDMHGDPVFEQAVDLMVSGVLPPSVFNTLHTGKATPATVAAATVETKQPESVAQPMHEPAPSRLAASDDEWTEINRLLQEAGVAPVELEQLPGDDMVSSLRYPIISSVTRALRAVLIEYRRRGNALQQALADAMAQDRTAASMDARQTSQLADAERESLRAQIRTADQAARALQQELHEVKAKHALEMRESKQQLVSLRQVLSVAEHRCKAEETEVVKLKAKLSAVASKHRDEAERSKRVFQQLQHRAARPSSESDQKLLDVITMYENQRRTLEREVAFLQQEVSQLNAEVRTKDNVLDQSGIDASFLSASANGSFNASAMNVQVQKQLERAAVLRAKEKELAEKASLMKKELQAAAEHAFTLQQQVDNLQLELRSRPTAKDWRRAQHLIRKLEHQVQAAVDCGVPLSVLSKRAAAEQNEAAARRAMADTRELMRKDKEAFKLQLHRIELVPRDVLHTVLKDMCLLLELSDVTELPRAVAKLNKAVHFIPKLETFYRQACDMLGTSMSGEDRMSASVAQLRSWRDGMDRLHEAEGVLQHIRDALAHRVGKPLVTTDSEMLQAIRGLVAVEAQLAQHRDIFHAAEAAMGADRQTDELLRQIVGHFQKLFDVKSLDGVFPKMTKLYSYVNEMRNFSAVLRGMLGVDASRASTNNLLAAVRQLIHEQHQHRRGGGAPVDPAPFDRTVPTEDGLPHEPMDPWDERASTDGPSAQPDRVELHSARLPSSTFTPTYSVRRSGGLSWTVE